MTNRFKKKYKENRDFFVCLFVHSSSIRVHRHRAQSTEHRAQSTEHLLGIEQRVAHGGVHSVREGPLVCTAGKAAVLAQGGHDDRDVQRNGILLNQQLRFLGTVPESARINSSIHTIQHLRTVGGWVGGTGKTRLNYSK
jgi:hypothetical protein